MKYKATIPGTESLLVGDKWDPYQDEGPVLGTLRVGLGADKWQNVIFYSVAGWKVEPIIELPTNKHAIVLIDGVAYWRGEANKDAYVWSDSDGGDWWSHEYIARQWERADDFDILFDGIAPEGVSL